MVNWPMGEVDLSRAEASMGVSIPEGYRMFLQATDGGRPVGEMWFYARVGVADFLGAQEIVDRRMGMQGRLPETLLPIADAAGGTSSASRSPKAR